MAKNEKQTKLSEMGLIDSPRISITKYVGKKVKICNVKRDTGRYGECVIVTTEKPTNARRYFGLATNEAGKVGWTRRSKLAEFLEKMNVSNPVELIGKEVTLQSTKKDDKEYLTFD